VKNRYIWVKHDRTTLPASWPMTIELTALTRVNL
jgi:hypothetical protein